MDESAVPPKSALTSTGALVLIEYALMLAGVRERARCFSTVPHQSKLGFDFASETTGENKPKTILYHVSHTHRHIYNCLGRDDDG